MPKITKETGASYGPGDAPVRETDDPAIMAVRRDASVQEGKAEIARLQRELNQTKQERDDALLSGQEQRDQQAERERQANEQDDDQQDEARSETMATTDSVEVRESAVVPNNTTTTTSGFTPARRRDATQAQER